MLLDCTARLKCACSPATPTCGTCSRRTSGVSCHVILIYHIALIHHMILIYFVLISYILITIIHYPGIISHHADIMLCCYIMWYHIIWYGYFNCWYNIIHIYRSHGNNLRYINWYYLGIKRLPLNWKFLNLLLRLECNYTSIPLHSSKYLSSQECYFRLLTVVFWPFNVLTIQFFYP